MPVDPPAAERRQRQETDEETYSPRPGAADSGSPARLSPVTGELGAAHEAAVRALNFAVALVSLLALSPVLALIAVAVKLDSSGPILYRQIRVGVDRRGRRGDGSDADADRRTGNLGGLPFVIYKFRTMRVNAEEESGPTWSSSDDDRTTRVGRFLRRHRLDELPQLWNVVKGDMAIVGPRPERPLFFQSLRDEIERYPRRQTVPPGITGWAQINQDSDQCVDDVQEKIRYDLEYLERRSLWFDAWIMVRTPLFMVRRDLLSRPTEDDAEAGDAGREREETAAPAADIGPASATSRPLFEAGGGRAPRVENPA